MELKSYFTQDNTGNVVEGATCYLYISGTTTLVSAVFGKDDEPITNPFTSDFGGLVQFKAPNGVYDLRIVSGIRDYTVSVQLNDVSDTINVVETAVTESAFQATRASAFADAAALNAGVYADTAAGILATTTGTYFSVPATASAEYLILYLNNAGVAVEQKRYPSKSYIDGKISSYQTSDALIPLFVDSVGNVPVWLDNGNLSATALSTPLLNAVIDSVGVRNILPTIDSSNTLVPLFVDSVGNVPLWLDDGQLAATGLSTTLLNNIVANVGVRNIIPTFDSANVLVPLFVDSVGNVPLWLEDGKLAATGVAPSLVSTITPSVVTTIDLTKSSTDSRTLFKYRANAAKLRTGSASQVRILMTGDSWTELSPISQAVADRLYALFGKSADGWVPVNAGTATLNGITTALVGTWTQYDVSTTGAAPDHGCGIDGRSITTAATNARYVISNVTCTEVEIFYHDLDGTFQYRAYDGADWQTVICGNTDTVKSVKLVGLADNTPRIVEVRTTVANTGTVRIHGLYFTRDAVTGAILNKCGNSGAIAQNLAVYANQIGYYAAKLNPDIVVIILGTNDYRVGVTIADYETHLGTLIDAYRAAVPGVGVILMAPAKTDGVATIPLVNFRNSMSKVAGIKGCEFYSLYDEFDSYTEMNALGMFADSFHLNNAGAAFVAGRLCTNFFNDR